MITKDISHPCLGPLVSLLPKLDIIFDFERNWWRLFQKRVVRTKFDIYVFIYGLIIIKAKNFKSDKSNLVMILKKIFVKAMIWLINYNWLLEAGLLC